MLFDDAKTDFRLQALRSIICLPDGSAYNRRQPLGGENDCRLHRLQSVEAVVSFEFAARSHCALQIPPGTLPVKDQSPAGQIRTPRLDVRSVSQRLNSFCPYCFPSILCLY